MSRKNIAIFLFDDVEVLDFAGPFEVFSVTNWLSDYAVSKVYTVARKKAPVVARNGLSVNPDFAIAESPTPDFMIIPGGQGTDKVLEQEDVIDWIRKCAESAEKIMSVCTGSLLLAKAGLLEGLRATTHHMVFDQLAQLAPNTEIVRGERFVDNGKIITSGGISAGIDMSLHVVEQVYGEEMALKTAAIMEYRRVND
jgi:transcriptional regulator GlxA family with amidase domain